MAMTATIQYSATFTVTNAAPERLESVVASIKRRFELDAKRIAEDHCSKHQYAIEPLTTTVEIEGPV